MYKIFNVSYDLNGSNKNYDGLFEELKKCYGWNKALKSTWIVVTQESAQQLFDRLAKQIDTNDHLLITQFKGESQGWMPKDFWEWLGKYSNFR